MPESKYKSMAMSITSTRLELLNSIDENQYSVTIINLEDEDHMPNGTQVDIKIPDIK